MENQSIMIVEDEPLIAMAINMGLGRRGYDVCGVARTGYEALEIADRYRPAISVMDIGLPGGLDGIGTAQELDRRMDINTIFLTGHSEPSVIDRAMSIKNSGLLLKPMSIDSLSMIIGSLLEESERSNERRFEASDRHMEERRRRHIRIPPNPSMPERISIVNYKEDYSLPVILTDISACGVGILSEDVYYINADLGIEVRLPDFYRPLLGFGIVRHSEYAGEFHSYGIELKLESKERNTLNDYMVSRLTSEQGTIVSACSRR